MRTPQRLLVSFLFAFSLLLQPVRVWADPACDALVEQIQKYGTTVDEVTKLQKFAEKHGLATQVLRTGPDARPVKRYFVALDWTKKEVLEDYLKEFNLSTPVSDRTGGTLVLEFQTDKPDYVTGVLRPSDDPEAPIYRWGKPDLKRTDWWQNWIMARTKNDPIQGYGYLIGLNPEEQANVKTFLDHPDLRAPCKSDNCVAWTSSIELGKTAADATDEDRHFLFTDLGMARSMAHFEINRRLMRAANERLSAVIVFVNGDAGVQAFKEKLTEFLPPDPKIPYSQIIDGFEFAPESELMKAVSVIPDGAKVFVPIGAGASPTGVQALIQAAGKAANGYEVSLLTNGVSEKLLRKGVNLADGKFRVRSLFLGGNLRKLYEKGQVTLIPGYLSDFVRFMKDPAMEDFHYDAIIVRVSPPDEQGHYSLGPNNDMIMDVIHSRPGIKVVAEVNPNIPHTKGENFLTAEQITSMFHEQTELVSPPQVPFTQAERQIGQNLATLIPDDSTLQIGIGNIFGGLASAMKQNNRHGVKIFTEMFGDPLKELMENGVANEATTGFAFGTEDLYKWLDHNEHVTFVGTEVVNDPSRVAATEKFMAVNTALQVDLLGNVNAEMGPNGVRISSPGGQVEFMSGAARSIGGKSIIAIRSTAKEGTISAITFDLYGGNVTTPHESVTEVVTEYGVAELKGKSTTQRALAMIRIAHPNFRKELAEKAVERHLITTEQAKEFLGG